MTRQRRRRIRRTTPSVYCALVEARPSGDCTVFNPSHIAGAFLRCYTPASSDDEARALIDAFLKDEHLCVENYEWCVDVDGVDWESHESDEAEAAEACIEQARRDDMVVVGDVHTWPVD